MFTGKPFFKNPIKTEIISVTIPFEDSHFASTLAVKKLYRDVGEHIQIIFYTPRSSSKAYEMFCKYPKLCFWMKKFKHTIDVEIGFKDFAISKQAELSENVVYLGISLDEIRSEK